VVVFVLGVGRGRGGTARLVRHGRAGRNMTSASWSLGLLVDVWRARARAVDRQFRLVGRSCWFQAGGPKQHGGSGCQLPVLSVHMIYNKNLNLNKD